MKKLFIVGEFRFYYYEESIAQSFEKNNFIVNRFKIWENRYIPFLFKLEYYFSYNFICSYLLFRKLKKNIISVRPDFILIWRSTLITPKILKKIKNIDPNIKIISYNNDNPFQSKYKENSIHLKRLWKNFKKCIPFYDLNLVYRPKNIEQYNLFGSQKTILFPPAFINNTFYISSKHYVYDVIFIGYFEYKRLLYINYLIENGINCIVFGTGWPDSLLSSKYKYGKIIELSGNEYFFKMSESRIVLAFLSELNIDVYTRRNFEIPGTGNLMLSEKTFELSKLYKEGCEAYFFVSKEDLLSKVIFLLKNEKLQDEIRKAGRNKVFSAGYDLDSRVVKLIEYLNLV